MGKQNYAYVAIVAIVAIVVLVLSFGGNHSNDMVKTMELDSSFESQTNNVAGQAIQSKDFQIKCVDSDSGDDPFTPGSVVVTPGTFKDVCNGNVLLERSCTDHNKFITIEHVCEHGCIAEDPGQPGYCYQPSQSTCVDSDGENTQTIGSVSVNGNTVFTDNCLNSETVREGVCEDNNFDLIPIDCNFNEECRQGHCYELFPPTCDNTGDGTEENPYEIRSCQELQDIEGSLNPYSPKYYEFCENVDCSESQNWTGGEGFDRITEDNYILNGNGYKVSNMFTSKDHFFESSDTTIKNLIFEHPKILSESSIAGGYAFIGLSGNSNLHFHNVGVIEPDFEYQKQHLKRVYAGTFFGMHSSTNFQQPEIFDSYILGGEIKVIVSNNAGGYTDVGAIKGSSRGSSSSTGDLKIKRVYSSVELTRPASSQYLTYTTESNLIFNDDYYLESVGSDSRATGLTQAEMEEEENYEGWDFSNIWKISPDKNNGMPHLRIERD